jgi:hypothetical protein
MPSFSAGIRGVKRACLLGLFICSWFSAQALAEDVGQRGGSFCVVPSLLLPAGSLAAAFNPGVEWNLDFDVGLSPAKSVIFGVGYSDLESSFNREGRLVLVPAWFGFKSKAQFDPSVELYWSLAGELVYEKAYVRGNTGTGSLENLDGGAVAGAGFDLWLTPWLVAGVSSRAHFVIEGGQLYPLMELGLRIGVRG